VIGLHKCDSIYTKRWSGFPSDYLVPLLSIEMAGAPHVCTSRMSQRGESAVIEKDAYTNVLEKAGWALPGLFLVFTIIFSHNKKVTHDTCHSLVLPRTKNTDHKVSPHLPMCMVVACRNHFAAWGGWRSWRWWKDKLRIR
jgi:hypothetical protein